MAGASRMGAGEADRQAAGAGIGRPVAAREPGRPARIGFFPAGAKSVGAFLPGVTRKAFERYGFPAAAILTDWPQIAGQELAAYTRPERLRWPRAAEADAESDDEAVRAAEPARKPDRRRPGATLVLRVDGPRAIEVQYRSAQLIERINAYFGFRAVAELRILQAPVAARPADRGAKAPCGRQPVPREVIEVKAGAHDSLQAALERLGRSVGKGRPAT